MTQQNIHSEMLGRLFFKSALDPEGRFTGTQQVLNWIKQQNELVTVKVIRTKFSKLANWSFRQGRLIHSSGKYFSIDGIQIKTDWGAIKEWDQPIINQAEVGFLGFITKEIEGVLHFLVQAKIEPGNVNNVQLSPTLQATRSNYTRVHQGKAPAYLEYFLNASAEEILLDQLQSEQGARFLRKRNRNIIIRIEKDIPLLPNFTWLTLGQLKTLMRFDNVVNMDTRTVVSGIPFGNYGPDPIDMFLFIHESPGDKPIQKALIKSALLNERGVNSIDQIITFLTRLKSESDLLVRTIPLDDLSSWDISDEEIFHKERKYFRVIPVDVEISNREVACWSQPMVQPAQEGLCAFVCKEIDGLLHFVVQGKMECGNLDIVEFAPTVQCLTGNYRESNKTNLHFLDYVLNASEDQIIYNSVQSEEGGRFYREQNRNMIILGGEDISDELPERYIWMTLSQIYTFLKFNNYLNIQARSLVAAVSFL